VFLANVLTVMIAYPSDCVAERDQIRQVIYGWNSKHARHLQVMLAPVDWSMTAIPNTGSAPQSIIDAQVLDQADIVLAVFRSRLGATGPEASSGTVHEIDRATSADKAVHVYFASMPHPADVDLEQLQALRDFKTALGDRALYSDFASTAQLLELVESHLLARVWDLNNQGQLERPVTREEVRQIAARQGMAAAIVFGS
jgi:hypothetical protein